MIATFETGVAESGIYCAIHRDSGMIYVGSSVNMRQRRLSHGQVALRGSKTFFHRVLREFGPDSFDFEVLEFCPKEKLLEREKFWMAFMNATSEHGLNTVKNPLANYDREISEITRQRMSAAGKGRKMPPRSEEWMEAHRNFRHSEETKKRLSEMKKGKKMSDEFREKCRQRQLGVIPSEESREKRRQSCLGRKMSPESIEKTRQANLGKVIPEEMRKRISESLKGRKRDPEAAKKAGDSNRGRKRTPEQAAKIREGILRSWAEGKRKPKKKGAYGKRNKF